MEMWGGEKRGSFLTRLYFLQLVNNRPTITILPIGTPINSWSNPFDPAPTASQPSQRPAVIDWSPQYLRPNNATVNGSSPPPVNIPGCTPGTSCVPHIAPIAQPTSPPIPSPHPPIAPARVARLLHQRSSPVPITAQAAREYVNRRGVFAGLSDAPIINPFVGMTDGPTSTPEVVATPTAVTPAEVSLPAPNFSLNAPQMNRARNMPPSLGGERQLDVPQEVREAVQQTEAATAQLTPPAVLNGRATTPSPTAVAENLTPPPPTPETPPAEVVTAPPPWGRALANPPATTEVAASEEPSAGQSVLRALGAFFGPIGDALSGIARMYTALAMSQMQNDGVSQGLQSNPLLAQLFQNSQSSQSPQSSPAAALAAMQGELGGAGGNSRAASRSTTATANTRPTTQRV